VTRSAEAKAARDRCLSAYAAATDPIERAQLLGDAGYWDLEMVIELLWEERRAEGWPSNYITRVEAML
jgi:hypothetical protein